MNLKSCTKEAHVSSVNFTYFQLCTVVLTASQFLCLILVQELNSCRCKSWTFALFSVSVWPRWETCKAIRAVRSATGEYSIFVWPSQWSSASLWRAYGKRMHVAQAHACGTHVCVALVCARVCVQDMTPRTCKNEMSREKKWCISCSLPWIVSSFVAPVYSYGTVYSYITLKLPCVCMYSYVTRIYSYGTCMHSYVTRMHSYVLVCFFYVAVCTRMGGAVASWLVRSTLHPGA